MTSQTHALYRFYAADGALLYVGITSDPGARWKKHRDEKPWWHEVRGISLESYPSREDVLAAERRAIDVEHPRYNKQRPPLRRTTAPRPTTTPRVEARPLVWVCEVCRLPIDDGAGYLHVVHADVYAVRRAEQAWHAKYDAVKLLQMSAYSEFPAPARWRAHHEACDPDPESGDYVIDIKRARTHAKLLDWTAHLMGKNWMKQTDWLDVIQRMSGVDA